MVCDFSPPPFMSRLTIHQVFKTTCRNDSRLSCIRARPEAGAMPQNFPTGIVSGATYLVGLFFLSVEWNSFALRVEQREDTFRSAA